MKCKFGRYLELFACNAYGLLLPYESANLGLCGVLPFMGLPERNLPTNLFP